VFVGATGICKVLRQELFVVQVRIILALWENENLYRQCTVINHNLTYFISAIVLIESFPREPKGAKHARGIELDEKICTGAVRISLGFMEGRIDGEAPSWVIWVCIRGKGSINWETFVSIYSRAVRT
jgi:hypothetical protein